MNYLRQVQKGIDYVEEHLDEEIELAEVTRAAGVSHWHFLRTFKALTGETLKGYVRSRRLANARILLLTTNESILAIALRAGFDSQAAFTRAFRDAFGTPPARYRALGSEHLFLEKVRIDEAYLRHLGENVSLTPTIEHFPERHFVGLPTLLHGEGSERNNVAERLPPLWAAFVPRREEIEGAVPCTCYGIVRQAEPGHDLLEYAAAMEIPAALDAAARLPEGMVHVVVPAATYAVFTHRGDPKTLDHTVNYVYSVWLAQSDRRHTYGADLEIYGNEYEPGSSSSVMGYAIPIYDPAP